jgi:hypothetical protein
MIVTIIVIVNWQIIHSDTRLLYWFMKNISYCTIEEDRTYCKYTKGNCIRSSLSSEKLITHNWSHCCTRQRVGFDFSTADYDRSASTKWLRDVALRPSSEYTTYYNHQSQTKYIMYKNILMCRFCDQYSVHYIIFQDLAMQWNGGGNKIMKLHPCRRQCFVTM